MNRKFKNKKSKILSISIIAIMILGLNTQLIDSQSIKKQNIDKNFSYNMYKNKFIEPNIPPSSFDNKNKKIIGPYDEGSHNNTNHKYQEWWYFNGLIMSPGSELDNWSFMISFNKMKLSDMFFSTLYDDKNNSYGGVKHRWPGAVTAEKGPGVNVSFENKAYVKGSYPDWSIIVKKNRTDGKNISYNLKYHANSKPHWLIFNSGKNNENSLVGHYSILNCTITGNITIDDKKHEIFGYGYHEHHWFTYINEMDNNTYSLKNHDANDLEHKLNVWDWYCISLDNGWNLFIANILEGSKIGKILPNIMWLTPDGENFSKCMYYKVEFINTTETNLKPAEIPEKLRIRGFFLSTLLKNPLKGLMYIDCEIETVNICEMVFGDPPVAGVWEGTCKIKGKLRWGFNNIDIKGRGIVEMTRG